MIDNIVKCEKLDINWLHLLLCSIPMTVIFTFSLFIPITSLVLITMMVQCGNFSSALALIIITIFISISLYCTYKLVFEKHIDNIKYISKVKLWRFYKDGISIRNRNNIVIFENYRNLKEVTLPRIPNNEGLVVFCNCNIRLAKVNCIIFTFLDGNSIIIPECVTQYNEICSFFYELHESCTCSACFQGVDQTPENQESEEE